MKKIFILILLLSNGFIYAQKDNPRFFPPSPNAYALGKYGDIPVNLYTGVPDISIPIYTIREKEIVVPVSVSYHGSGIKVDETASEEGLGWALNAGGVITRSIRGKAEFLSNGNLSPTRADIPQCTNCTDANNINNFVTQKKLPQVVDGQYDGEPDIFYYNFNGRSGRFCFDKNGIPRLNKEEAIQISWVQGPTLNNEKFIIKDESGLIYEFDSREVSYYGNEEGLKVSAWYLSKITSPAGNIVTFLYETYNYSRTERYYSKEVVNIPINQNSGIIYGPTGPVIYSSGTENGLKIKEIVTSKEKVVFSYLGNRLDVLSGSIGRIDKISIYNVGASSAFKSFNFYTSYFEANNSRKYNGPNPSANQYLNYRLKLDSIKEVNALNASGAGAYKFYYTGDNNPTTDDPYTLPYRLSPAQDYWGYYNFTYNNHLLPGTSNKYLQQPTWYSEFTPDPYSNTSSFITLSGGANRNVNTEAVKANILKTIEYPTGGLTNFEFEPNDYQVFQGGLRVKSTKSYSSNGSQPIETTYSYSSSYSTSDLDPEKFIFEYYYVGWDNPMWRPIPSQKVLNMFGLPTQTSANKCVKILTSPTSILGALSNVSHSSVTVQQTGKGKVVNFYASTDDHADYINSEYFGESTQDENALLNGLYFSEVFEVEGPSLFEHKVKSLEYGEFPYNELYSNDWKRGVLIERKTFNQNDVLIKQEDFSYYKTLKNTIPGFKVLTWEPFNSPSAHLYSKYLVPNAWSQLRSSIVKEYDQFGQNPLTTQIEYFYDNQNHQQITRTEMTNSLGNKETKYISYPLDYPVGTSFIDAMKNSHLLAYPIEQINHLTTPSGNYIQSGTITEYAENAIGVPLKNYTLETKEKIPTGSFKYSNRTLGVLPPTGNASSFLKDSRYKPSFLFNKYDLRGNILEQQKSGDLKEVYLWGYSQQYPVVKVLGSSFATVMSIPGIDTSLINNGSVSQRQNQYTLLRNYFSSNPSIQVFTYTYSPLIGMTSETGPDGRTTYYEYDSFGRLSVVRDDQNKVLKKICYNYAGQQVNCN